MSWFQAAGFDFQEFSVGGVRTFAVVEGRREGVPLVLLHGIPGASFVWSTTIQAAGRDRRVIAPDLPGWGRSVNRARPVKIKLTLEFLTEWLAALLHSQGIESFDVIGHGSGAWLALELMLSHSGRVRRLGLLNMPLREVRQLRNLPFVRKDWNGRRLNHWLMHKAEISEEIRKNTGPLFRELFESGHSAKGSPEFPDREYRAKMSEYGHALREFQGEATLWWGQRDAGFDGALARGFAGQRATVLFEKSAHYPMWDEAEKYREMIAEFTSE